MTVRLRSSGRAAALVLGVAGVALATGCERDWRDPIAIYVACDAEVWKCPKTASPPAFTLGSGSSHPNISKYLTRKNFWEDSKAAHQVYWNKAIFVFDPGPDKLPGSTMVMTGRDDWSVTDASFMTVTLGEDVEGIYVAYDSRAQPRPAWLKDQAKYERLTKQMTISVVDHSISPQGYVMLDVYRSKTVTKSGQTLTIPGNNHGGPGWPALPQGDPAMYLVFVNPESRVPANCGAGAGSLQSIHHWNGCHTLDPWDDAEVSSAIAAARLLAATACVQDNPNDVCRPPTCREDGWTKDPCWSVVRGSTGRAPGLSTTQTFQHHSEAAFLPAASSVSGTVAGGSFASAISGTLLFEYRGDSLAAMRTMRLNRMSLDLQPFGTEIGALTEIKVALVVPADAECQDSPAPAVTPCGSYRIPVGGFRTTAGLRIDGQPTAISMDNDRAIDVFLDPVTHTFRFTGSLQGTATVNDEPHALDITLTLDGQVVNYAPKALADIEGDGSADCADETNAAPIQLYAGDSFDIEDGPLPNSSFEWYEDWGLVTQVFWGQGAALTIGRGQLGFGVHNFTLVVNDSNGILATDTVTVTVDDLTPPALTPPPDVEVYTLAAPPVAISIGEAFAAEECLPLAEDALTHDAPADGRFGAGQTIVTWRADDGRGNVETATQLVEVHVVVGIDSLLDAVRAGIAELQAAGSQTQSDVSQCGEEAACDVSAVPLVWSVDRLIMMTHDAMQHDDGGPDAYAALLGGLETARMHYLEAAGALDESAATDDADLMPILRGQALDHLAAAGERLADAAMEAESLAAGGGARGSDPPPPDRDNICGFGAPLAMLVLPLALLGMRCAARRRRRTPR